MHDEPNARTTGNLRNGRRELDKWGVSGITRDAGSGGKSQDTIIRQGNLHWSRKRPRQPCRGHYQGHVVPSRLNEHRSEPVRPLTCTVSSSPAAIAIGKLCAAPLRARLTVASPAPLPFNDDIAEKVRITGLVKY